MKTNFTDFMNEEAMEKIGKEAVWVYKDVHKQLKVLSAQTGKPIRTYVVAGDVTTAQGLERNIVEESSLGQQIIKIKMLYNYENS